MPKIVAFAGSLRADSFNRKLLAVAVDAARAAGAEVTVVDLRELALPLFDQDLEDASGLPDGAKRFKALLREADGLLIASPEYNSTITAALKNAIDWASRAESDDEPPLVAFKGKAAALLAASPGALGGLRGLVTVRSLLGNIGCPIRSPSRRRTKPLTTPASSRTSARRSRWRGSRVRWWSLRRSSKNSAAVDGNRGW